MSLLVIILYTCVKLVNPACSKEKGTMWLTKERGMNLGWHTRAEQDPICVKIHVTGGKRSISRGSQPPLIPVAQPGLNMRD
jgi:hypothetical protein